MDTVKIGDHVNANMCGSCKLGIGIVTSIEGDIIRVQTPDGNFPLYAHEITSVPIPLAYRQS